MIKAQFNQDECTTQIQKKSSHILVKLALAGGIILAAIICRGVYKATANKQTSYINKKNKQRTKRRSYNFRYTLGFKKNSNKDTYPTKQ